MSWFRWTADTRAAALALAGLALLLVLAVCMWYGVYWLIVGCP